RLALAAGIAAALAATAAALVWTSATVQDRIVERIAAEALARGPGAALVQGGALRGLICGSSSPLPGPTRANARVAVSPGARSPLVDTGPGAWNRLALLRVPGDRIGAVLLTHFPSDHIGDLGEVDLQTWVAGRPGPLEVVGPPGVERVVAGFEEAYA